MPQVYQSMLMSATMSADVDQLKQLVLRNPAVLKLEDGGEEDLLVQYSVVCPENDKFLLSYFLLKLRVHPFGTGKCIIFVNSIDKAYLLKLFLEQFGVRCCTLHGELPVRSRVHIVQEFNKGVYDYVIAVEGERREEDSDGESESDEEEEVEGGKARVVVEDEGEDEGEKGDYGNQDAEVGDVEKPEEEKSKSKKRVRESVTSKQSKKRIRGARVDPEYGVSRGIDFTNVQAVINFDIPKSAKSYMHRVGRTARGVGNQGWALNFLVPSDDVKVKKGKKMKGKKEEKGEESEAEIFERIKKKQA
ncbi:ATP-dependent DNA/RNA helicase, partial [Nowakowskiella sp. JEL0407]